MASSPLVSVLVLPPLFLFGRRLCSRSAAACSRLATASVLIWPPPLFSFGCRLFCLVAASVLVWLPPVLVCRHSHIHSPCCAPFAHYYSLLGLPQLLYKYLTGTHKYKHHTYIMHIHKPTRKFLHTQHIESYTKAIHTIPKYTYNTYIHTHIHIYTYNTICTYTHAYIHTHIHKHNTQHTCIPHTNIYDVWNIHMSYIHTNIPHITHAYHI